jgi:hypothetical protein
MTKSYGLEPTLSNPSDVESLSIDFRNLEGSSKCCQFYSDILPPAWYYFSKNPKEYSDPKFGINKTPYGSWRSGLTHLVVDELPLNTDMSPGFEVIENKTETMSVLHEKGANGLNVIGASRPSGGTPPASSVVNPAFIGQMYIDTFGDVWIAVDVNSNSWYLVGMGVGS